MLLSAVCVGLEMLLFLMPISIVPYLPSFFFGSLLMLFGVEISLSWLVLSYKKVHGRRRSVTCFVISFGPGSTVYSHSSAWKRQAGMSSTVD